ncbi:MAG: ABC-F family ATP-binding cassette domain-containing protein, partial [Anaerolineae bacterium]|nr:ABC-F family ATP-binding cassette domain-containing protein [Anaerolineae bacterium]
MHVIQLHHITVNYTGHAIFRDLNWAIGDRDRIGLVGPNGAGKSSLFKAIIGEVIPDEGQIVKPPGITLGYLPQEVKLTPGQTVIEEAMTMPPALAQTEAALSVIDAQLADPDVYNDADRLAHVLAEQERVLEGYERLGGPSHANTVRGLLLQLGFSLADFDLPTEALSGGQKKLVALVRLVIETPDVLLLDEPDNHLDLAGKRRLERYLRSYQGAVVIISHDRYLLDDVATQIAELDGGKITMYQGNYSAYVNERELRRLRQQQMYAAQQKEIQKIEEAIKRFELWAKVFENEKAARQARSRHKMLERMEANGEIIE